MLKKSQYIRIKLEISSSSQINAGQNDLRMFKIIRFDLYLNFNYISLIATINSHLSHIPRILQFISQA